MVSLLRFPQPERLERMSADAPHRSLVLVAEDHDDTREMLRTLLALDGFDVVDCADGTTAVATAASLHPDVILINRELPRVDGLRAAREIRRIAPACAGRIILMASQPSAELQQEADGEGQQVLLAPYDIERLLETVRRLASAAVDGSQDGAGER
jgi:CheY-like chemotaxis protein